MADAQYYYDELGRLIQAVAGDGSSVQYSYDAVGNVTAVRYKSAAAIGISGFMPISGPVGTTVTIYGSGFSTTPSSNVVQFNGTSANVSSATATSLIVTVPAGATTGPITVGTSPSVATSSTNFTVAALAAPTLTGFSPTIAAQGATVTLTGTNFQSALETNKVLFGSMPTPAASATPTTLATAVPTQASSGKISVTTPYGVATSAADFFAVPAGYTAASVAFTGRLSVDGAGLVAAIASANSTGLVLFDGVAGQTGLTVVLSNVTMGGGINVYAPDGRLLKYAGGVVEGAQFTLPKLPMTGTYTILLYPGTSVGSATMRVGKLDLSIGPLTIGTIVANQGGSWTIPVTYTVTNSGTVTAQPGWKDAGYLSANGALDNDSQSYGSLNYRTTLAPGASYTVTANFTTSVTAPGTYTFFVKTDGHNPSVYGTNTDNGDLAEADETNNTASVTLTLARPDLSVGPLTLGTIVANQNGSWTIPVTYTVTNIGTMPAQPIWYDAGYLSANGVLDGNSQTNTYLGYRTTALAPGANYTVTSSFTTSTSTAPGNYTFFVKADGRFGSPGYPTLPGALGETDVTNNTASATVTLSRPDLAIGPLTLGTVVANQNGSWTIPVTYTVTNSGTATAQPTWYDIGYLSSNGVLDNSSQSPNPPGYLSTRGPLAPGASYSVTANFTTSVSTAPGTYTFFVKTDGHNATYTGGTNTDNGALTEASETNNTASATVTLSRPDLAIGPLTLGTIVANQNGSWTIPVTYTVTNSGGAPARPTWYDVGYLSSNGVLDNNSLSNSSQSNGLLAGRGTELAPGASYSVTANFTTSSSTTPGTYTFFVKTDGRNSVIGGTNIDNGALTEASEANNTASAMVTLVRPDLTIGAPTVGTIVANSNGSWTIPVTYTVTNSGTVAAPPNWYDVGYLSSNGVLDNSSQSTSSLSYRNTALAPGASYTVTANFITSTSTTPGSYTFFVKADGHNASLSGTNTDNGAVPEADETNNTASATLTLVRPDLTIGALTIGTIAANLNGSWTIPATYTVTNSGTVAAQPGWYDIGYLSSNGVLDGSSQSNSYLSYRNTALAPGASYTVTANFITSASTTSGSYTFFVKADGHNSSYGGTNIDNGSLSEADETNNKTSATITLARPDLTVGAPTLGSATRNADGSWRILVTYTVTNTGTVTAPAGWYDMGYLSSNGVLDNGSQSNSYLGYRGTALAPGASYTVTAYFTTSTSTTPGTYTFFVKADGHNTAFTGGSNTDNGYLVEADETNNASSSTVTLN